jgi:hypothetical protein
MEEQNYDWKKLIGHEFHELTLRLKTKEKKDAKERKKINLATDFHGYTEVKNKEKRQGLGFPPNKLADREEF